MQKIKPMKVLHSSEPFFLYYDEPYKLLDQDSREYAIEHMLGRKTDRFSGFINRLMEILGQELKELTLVEKICDTLLKEDYQNYLTSDEIQYIKEAQVYVPGLKEVTLKEMCTCCATSTLNELDILKDDAVCHFKTVFGVIRKCLDIYYEVGERAEKTLD